MTFQDQVPLLAESSRESQSTAGVDATKIPKCLSSQDSKIKIRVVGVNKPAADWLAPLVNAHPLPAPTIAIQKRRHPIVVSRPVDAAVLKKRANGLWLKILADAGIYAAALKGTHGRPCPKCDGTDRFAPMSDFKSRGAVHCRWCFNTDSEIRPGDGIATLRWWLECSFLEALKWLDHWLSSTLTANTNPKAQNVANQQRVQQTHDEPPSQNPLLFREIANSCRLPIDSPMLLHFASQLCVTVQSLHRLGVGYSHSHKATTWPMLHANGNVTGVRLRSDLDGSKFAVKGSKDGLFLADDILASTRMPRLLVCEGPTDTTAMLDLGFHAVGTPSVGKAESILRDFFRRVSPLEIVFIAHNDQSQVGLQGAEKLARSAIRYAPCRVVTPPEGIKDARDWLKSGADRDAVEARISLFQVVSLHLKGTFNGL